MNWTAGIFWAVVVVILILVFGLYDWVDTGLNDGKK